LHFIHIILGFLSLLVVCLFLFSEFISTILRVCVLQVYELSKAFFLDHLLNTVDNLDFLNFFLFLLLECIDAVLLTDRLK